MGSIPLIFLLIVSLLTSDVEAEEINVAVASNFTAPMKSIATAFENRTGHKVKLSFGASGKFYAQIRYGAPFQVFFSADQAKPKQLEDDNLIVTGSRFTYAVGALALWSAQPNFINNDASKLKSNDVRKIALANPKLAPYGAAAIEVLTHLELHESTKSKWVKGENIAQTYQFISTHNAELGFVSLSQILREGKLLNGSVWIIPTTIYSPIKQDAVLLQKGKDSEAAQSLLNFMRSEHAIRIIESFGYAPSTRALTTKAAQQ